MSEQRAVPFYCPFCAEEDLFPAEETHGTWHCRSCARVFSLRLVGLHRAAAAARPRSQHEQAAHEGAAP